MDLLACLDVPAFPLQLLLQRHPGWRRLPAAVVDRDDPQGIVQWVNEHALRRRVLPGMRYAAGLSLAAELRAGVIDAGELEEGVRHLLQLLSGFSPGVEPAERSPGVFWIDASGLARLHPSPGHWGRGLLRALAEQQYRAALAVGFTRFGTFAVARARRKPLEVFPDREAERHALREVPLARLDLDPDLRDSLARLGIHTVGAFLRLPAAGLRDRFGAEAHELHRQARGESDAPLRPVFLHLPLDEVLDLDFAVTSTTLVFLIKRLLHSLLARLAARREALERLDLLFLLEHHAAHPETLRPAAPTLDLTLLLSLVALRLESLRFAAAIEAIHLTAHGSPATPEQLLLFRENPRRNLERAARALARIRAEFGNDTVHAAKLQDRHLPEASFSWEPLDRLAAPHPGKLANLLVRRIRSRPEGLLPRYRANRNDGWLLNDLRQGSVIKDDGPYLVSGGWWSREVHREYHHVQTTSGDLLWVYYDRPRRRWFLQGEMQ